MKRIIFLALSVVVLGCGKEELTQAPEEVVVEVPVANADNFSFAEGEEVIVLNLLENDELSGNAAIKSIDATTEGGAQIIDNRNGSFTIVFEDDFLGEDTFTYSLCDFEAPENCSEATVTITIVDAGNPVAVADAATTTEGVALTIEDVLANDTVVDGAALTAVDATGTGEVTLNDDGTITYVPADGFTGEDTFTYTICDNDQPEASCSTATVTVTVTINDAEGVSFNIPADLQSYYSGVSFTDDMDANYTLLSTLSVDKHTNKLYYSARHDYLYKADADPNNADNVLLVYSGDSRYWEEYHSGNNPHEPQTFNTEHIYPKSKLDSSLEEGDLHHLRTADRDVNSQRGNYPFTDGSGDYKLVDGNKWFPGDEWKGDVARMIMYMNVRYGEDFESVGDLQMFLEWNVEDPVSEFEIMRNEVISDAQGVRNPFIDNPYLATLLWGGDAAENLWE